MVYVSSKKDLKRREIQKKKAKSGGFESLNLSPNVFNAIKRKGYKVPTPIQRKTMPLILAGNDVVAMARTGSGKTAAFLIPMLERLKEHVPQGGVRALILSPTRDLALQTHKFTKELSRFMDVRISLLVGGDSMETQFEELAQNPDIIIATPGRLMHHLAEVDDMTLRTVEYVVFDEADCLFGMGFAEQLHKILGQLSENRQTLLFSATLPSALAEFAKAGLQDPRLVRLDLDTKISPDLKLMFFTLRQEEKHAAILYLIREHISSGEQTLIFVSTKHHVEFLNILFREEGIEPSVCYGDMDHDARQINVSRFRSRKTMQLIVTDVAARGIDIPLLDNVINWDFPPKPKLFVHRVGRAARAGRTGTAFSFVTSEDIPNLLDLHLFLSKPIRAAPTEEEVLHDMDGVMSKIDQAIANGETVYGRFPQTVIDLVSDRVREIIDSSSDLSNMVKTCANAFRLYSKTKPPPSKESVKRAKDLPREGLHPIFKSVLDGGLNFTSNPFQPTGECLNHVKQKINVWGSYLTSPCCRNVLTTMSKALAIHAVKTQGSAPVFLSQQDWKNCSGPFQKERSVSAENCHFGDLYYGSSTCSNTTLASIKTEQAFQNAIRKCANLSNAFDDVCGNCSKAVLGLRDSLLKAYGVKDGNATETGICGIAAVISVLEEKMNNTFLIDNDYMWCMSLLDAFDPGYVKLKYSLAEAILSILIGITTVTLIILLIHFVTKKKPQKPVLSGPITTWSGLYRFSKAEIENAINTERKDLGRGSAGQVYKGVLPSGQVVAIKHINKSNKSDSFTREVEGLSRVRHPNLVCLFGCCVEDGEQYLVYEYCAKGNLAQHLLRNDPVLTWERRVKILRDCALALRYLHHYIDGCIVHRDIKLTNILLTNNLEPKLSDFGLAKMLGMEESKVFTDVRGTIGYMDPEYMTNAKLTCASDVYSFGIVALQLLSGQKVFELDLDARDQLTRKAKDISMNKRPPEDLEDPRMNGNVNKADFESILQVAVLCVAKSSKGRPTIDLVFEEMDKAWKNTLADMKARLNKGIGSSATPVSTSSDVFSV